MKKIKIIIAKSVLIFLFFSLFSGNASAQFYEWAFAPAYVSHGSYGSFTSTDMHGNGYFKGLEVPILGNGRTALKSYGQNGQINWSVTYSASPYEILGVDADSSGNRYVLLDKTNLSGVFGNYNITEDFVLIKYNSSGAVIRATGLIEKFNQIKVDSVGNAFISTGNKVVRYNKFGLFSWQYTTPFVHKLFVDNAKNNYLVNDSIAIKLNSSGVLQYTHVEPGAKVVDSKGKLYVSTAGGLKRYDKFGMFQFVRPAITGTIQTNNNGNIYEFRNDSILKYNQSGTTLQWLFEDAPSPGVVNAFGDIYFGDNYDVCHDDIKLCPFRIRTEPYTYQNNRDQVWVAKLNGKDQPPFQAAVYTNMIRNHSSHPGTSEPNELCTSIKMQGSTSSFNHSTLFDYCTNASSSFDPTNEFTAEISDANGNFANAINIGNPLTNVVPDILPFGTGYRVRVVSSTAGVNYFPNLPYFSNGIKIYPNQADLSLFGLQTICDGDSLQLSIDVGDSSASIHWYQQWITLQGTNNSLSVLIDTSGYYFATVQTANCYHQTDTVFVTLNPLPSPIVSPAGPLVFCRGESVELEVSDIDLTSIAWQNNGVKLSGFNDTTYTALTSGWYTALVTNQFGCEKGSSIVNVHVSPPCRIGHFNSETPQVEIFPNPVYSNSDLIISGISEGENVISIYDASGKEVYKQKFYSEKGSQVSIPGNHFLSGVFMVRIFNGADIVRKMFVKM